MRAAFATFRRLRGMFYNERDGLADTFLNSRLKRAFKFYALVVIVVWEALVRRQML